MTQTAAPERSEHLLPHQAAKVEAAQSCLLDFLSSFGYQLVSPPLTEGIGDLLDGADGRLGELTLQLTDPLGGKPIGIRADITPQIRRIDASHYAKQGKVARLCYCGPTLYSRPLKPWLNREQLQAGAEIFGGDRKAAATEIIMIAHGAMAKLGIDDLFVTLGHAGICLALIGDVPIREQRAAQRFMSHRDLTSLASMESMKANLDQLELLASLDCDADKLAKISEQFSSWPEIVAALDELRSLSALLDCAGINHGFDLVSLSGYEYHNGATFTLLSGENVICRGGGFGSKERQATGFSLDLRSVASHVSEPSNKKKFATLRNFGDQAWHEEVNKLRSQDYVCILLDNWNEMPEDCEGKLIEKDGRWNFDTAEA